MLAAKNSIKRQAAFSPARAIAGGSRSRPARVSLPLGIGTTERFKLARVNDGVRPSDGRGQVLAHNVLYATSIVLAKRQPVKTVFHKPSPTNWGDPNIRPQPAGANIKRS